VAVLVATGSVLTYHPLMPLVTCPECSACYDFPAPVAVRLPSALAHCSCGHWLFGDKQQLLIGIGRAATMEELDVTPYRVETPPVAEQPEVSTALPPPNRPRSLRVIARGAGTPLKQHFTLRVEPLWIGRSGCHVAIDDPAASIQHCSITASGDELVLRDLGSHTGTWLDGQPVEQAIISDGVHLIRIGRTLISVEPVEEEGVDVGPLNLSEELLQQTPATLAFIARKRAERSPVVFRCIEGSLAGREFRIPPDGLVVGREGSVQVPDEYLSRRHFALQWESEGVLRLVDLGSRNGTFLNSLPARRARVHPGDEIRAGMNLFRVESE
jgi:pSer/pThr/pTyr-binding forkhead associated (FHA) protein